MPRQDTVASILEKFHQNAQKTYLNDWETKNIAWEFGYRCTGVHLVISGRRTLLGVLPAERICCNSLIATSNWPASDTALSTWRQVRDYRVYKGSISQSVSQSQKTFQY